MDDEDYFTTIPDQSLLIIAGPKEEVKTDFQLMLDSFRTSNAELLTAAEGTHTFVENNREMIKDWLNSLLKDQQTENEKLSYKNDDPDWFQGTDSKYNTKEEAMFRRAQDRIRGYFYKAKDELTKCDLYKESVLGKQHLDDLLRLFRMFLHGCDHFGCLFDRSRVEKDEFDSGEPLNKKTKTAITEIFMQENPFEDQCRTLCNDTGLFHCQGPWDDNSCPGDQHVINPYRRREDLIVFQTWNLDHQIEFGRTVIPRIITTLQRLINDKPSCPYHKGRPVIAINAIRFFLELFTTENLKLVHIACHVKEAHAKMLSQGGLLCEKCPDYVRIRSFCNKIEKS